MNSVKVVLFSVDRKSREVNIKPMARKLAVYFAKPYYSWERGTNENTNGLIRQFSPRSMQLDQQTEAQAVEDILNNRPRKILGYLTPLEVKSRNGTVALQC